MKRQPMVVSKMSAERENASGCLAHHERRARHRLDAAGDREIDLAGADGAARGADRIEAGGAEAVEGLAGNRIRQAREQQRHARDVAVVLAGLVGAAEKDFIDLGPVEPGMLCHQRLDRRRGQIVGAHLGERTAKTADRGPDGITNKHITHRRSPLKDGFDLMASCRRGVPARQSTVSPDNAALPGWKSRYQGRN